MRTAFTATIVLVFGLSVLVFAQTTDESPRLPAVKNAIKQYEVAAEKARKEYLMALIDLDRRLITDMEGALKQVMQAGNLDEAKRIEAAVLTAKETMGKHQDELRGKAKVQEFTIEAAKSWQPTIEVKKGQRVEVRASGTWNGAVDHGDKGISGPDGTRHPQHGRLTYYLEGKVGEGSAFKIGSRAEFTADTDGPLVMRMNDTNRPNNSGALSVAISVR